MPAVPLLRYMTQGIMDYGVARIVEQVIIGLNLNLGEKHNGRNIKRDARNERSNY